MTTAATRSSAAKKGVATRSLQRNAVRRFEVRPSTALRELLAEYHVLALYDCERVLRYGDMAASRRDRELTRLARELIDAGVDVDRRGRFPESSAEELRAAFARVAEPRARRVLRETYRLGSRYTQATIAAWCAVASKLGVTASEVSS